MADAVDAAIGSLSQFEAEFGYYAHGVGKDTARLPSGWQTRLVPVKNENTQGVTGWCLDVHDLALSKYAAARPKDLSFCNELVAHLLVKRQRLLELVPQMDLSESAARRLTQLINRAPWERSRDYEEPDGGLSR